MAIFEDICFRRGFDLIFYKKLDPHVPMVRECKIQGILTEVSAYLAASNCLEFTSLVDG